MPFGFLKFDLLNWPTMGHNWTHLCTTEATPKNSKMSQVCRVIDIMHSLCQNHARLSSRFDLFAVIKTASV